MIRRCIICGAEFSTPPSNNRRTCSPACSSQWRSKQHMGVSNRWSEGVKAAARAAAAKTGNLKNGTAAAMNLPERISIHAPLAGCDSKIAEIFPANLRKSYKISAKPNKERRCRVLGKGKAAAISGLARCEPPGENRNASGSHQIMSAPSGA